jgi:hypothetical protein
MRFFQREQSTTFGGILEQAHIEEGQEFKNGRKKSRSGFPERRQTTS